jgi:Ner family transcriptional regulator
MSRSSVQPERESICDWPASRIAYELKLRNSSFRQLAREHGYAANTLLNVTRVPWPKGEAIVAVALGQKVEAIWPLRVQARNRPRHKKIATA